MSISSRENLGQTFERTREHLEANTVDLSKTRMRIGPFLKLDPKSETLVGNALANAHLAREDRPGFVVPQPDTV